MNTDNTSALNIKPLGKGHNVTPELIALILRLYSHLKNESLIASAVSTYGPESRLVAYTGLSNGLVTRVLAEHHRTGQIPTTSSQKRGQKHSACPSYVERCHLINIRREVLLLNITGECASKVRKDCIRKDSEALPTSIKVPFERQARVRMAPC